MEKTRKAMGELRLELGNRLGLRPKDRFEVLWVVDFPLLEYNEEEGRYFAMHHPFTSPKPEDTERLVSDPGMVRANAYDLVINGVEIGGGSIRIFDRALQSRMFQLLGFSEEEAREQFGFLLEAFEYGAPPHGGIAFGLDRLCSLLGGADSIRDFIAFPKNNSGRDVMIDSPSALNPAQLKELSIALAKN
jgi:aspartyl-tRNA synthetase